MATFYLDYEGGNDANDGTSFANRWKTITSGATAARIAPGDTIRIMKSPDPTSVGTATWTNKSKTITLSSAKNALITDCDTAWTASANVTATADTTYYRGETGDKSAKLSIASGFTTGLVAYFGLGGAQNYSTYQGITLWLSVSAALAASTLSIRLCSDALGVTTVDTLALPAISNGAGAGSWFPIHIDKGSALGASIQSIALYADLDPGTIDVYLDNISTTKAVGDDCLTLKTLIGKNTADEAWYALRRISGTTLHIDSSPALASYQLGNASQGYSGTTESVTSYIRKTTMTTPPTFSFQDVEAIQDSGSAGSQITFSGGWDRTNMTVQDGETIYDGQNGWGNGLTTGVQQYFTLDKLGWVRYSNGLVIGSGAGHVFGTLKAGHCLTYGFYFNGSTSGNHTYLLAWNCAVNSGGGVNLFSTNLTIETIKSTSHGDAGQSAYGIYMSNQCYNVKINNVTVKNSKDGINGGASERIGMYFKNVTSQDNLRYGWISDWANHKDIVIENLTCQNNGDYGLYLGNGECLIKNLVTSGNTNGGVTSGPPGVFAREHVILKSSMGETTKVNLWASSAGIHRGGIRFRNFNLTANDHRFYIAAQSAEIFAETSVRHTASGLSWRMSPKNTDYYNTTWPLVLPLVKLAVKANALVTVSVWLRRTNTGLTGRLMCKGGQLNGIASDVSTAMTVAADTWEKVTVLVTPTEAGVLEFQVEAYGGTTYSLYVDDAEWSQA